MDIPITHGDVSIVIYVKLSEGKGKGISIKLRSQSPKALSKDLGPEWKSLAFAIQYRSIIVVGTRQLEDASILNLSYMQFINTPQPWEITG